MGCVISTSITVWEKHYHYRYRASMVKDIPGLSGFSNIVRGKEENNYIRCTLVSILTIL